MNDRYFKQCHFEYVFKSDPKKLVKTLQKKYDYVDFAVLTQSTTHSQSFCDGSESTAIFEHTVLHCHF